MQTTLRQKLSINNFSFYAILREDHNIQFCSQGPLLLAPGDE